MNRQQTNKHINTQMQSQTIKHKDKHTHIKCIHTHKQRNKQTHTRGKISLTSSHSSFTEATSFLIFKLDLDLADFLVFLAIEQLE